MNAFMTDWLIGTVLGVLHGWAISVVNLRVPEPYMDEEFHVAQARLYCEGKFDQWNPKITTPPGLYLLVYLFRLCNNERFLNSVLIPFCFVGLCRLRRRLQPDDDTFMVRITALTALSLPVLLDTSLLYYTDLLSLTAVVWAIGTGCPFHSFIAFSIALFARQSNIVWAAFYCFPFAWDSLLGLCRGETSPLFALGHLFRRLSLHITLALCFAYFVIFRNNGSIVLGDQAAHRPVFHLPQLLYFFAFTAASTIPQFLKSLMRNRAARLLNRLLFAVIFCAISAFAVHYYTMDHPYLLADNRHFTFYLWQRVFQRHWTIKYALIPLYCLCAEYLWNQMAADCSNKFAFFCTTALCLVPAHLIEFRYFIVPFTIWRLSVRTQRIWAVLSELAVNTAVNALALYLFFERPFRWSSQQEKLQHFMW